MPAIDPSLPGVYWEYQCAGYWREVYWRLRPSLGAFARQGRWPHMKIGYTSDPHRRWSGYKADGWTALVPLYFTRSARFAHDMERALIE